MATTNKKRKSGAPQPSIHSHTIEFENTSVIEDDEDAGDSPTLIKRTTNISRIAGLYCCAGRRHEFIYFK